MILKKYFQGKGLDVSRKPSLKDVKWFFKKPDNFYSLKRVAGYESLDFVYSKHLINETKFYRILLKEWFHFCKVGGHIIIEIKNNKILDFAGLIEECKILFDDKIKIVKEKENDEKILILEKIKPALEKNDSLNRWSFGIITNGKNQGRVNKEIDSIISLKIPKFEIIICGEHNFGKRKNVRVIEFDCNSPAIEDGNPNIKSLKKNIICKNAKYENLVITHDKFIFDGGWYEGMQKYGNYFEVLSCVVLDESGERAGDWLTHGTRFEKTGIVGLMDYEDWDKWGYVDGGLYILKKSVWKKVKWEERPGNRAEDLKLSKDFYEAGIVTRFNIFSRCLTLEWKHGKLVEYKFNKKKLGLFKKIPVEKYWWVVKQIIKAGILGKKNPFIPLNSV